jgi:Aerotolerance regulator N-terminal/von Willebrand factor type A domain
MGFLAPWFLAGMAAVGLPLYLHLLRRDARTPLPFSSLMFFEPRTQSSLHHRRLRYILLLSMRLALLVLLALAFANPFVNRLAARVPSDKLVWLVIDSSFSMRAGSRFSDARREAASLLASRRTSEHVQVMALDAQLHVLTEPTRDSASERAALEDIHPTDSRGRFGELVRAVRLTADSVHGPIELHLFSDLQRSNMAPSVSDMVLPDNVTLVLHPVIKEATPNWTVESVTAPAQVWGNPREGKAAHVQAVIAGYATPAATRTVSLVVNGKTVATARVQVPASGRASVEFPSLAVPYGFSRCEVRIDSADALPADDAYLFAVERSDPLRVLLVHAESDRSPLYFSNALTSAAESAFALQSVTTEQAASLPLSKYAFVVVSNVAALPASFEKDLLDYVRAGGSLLMALGTTSASRSRVPIFGNAIAEAHNYTREFSSDHERFLRVGETDPSHPSVGKAGNLSGVKFFYVVRVDAADSRVVARLTDHTPVLLDKKIGEGRGLLFASGLDNVTNDLPLHPVFVPFVEQTARYLSGAGRTAGARQVDSLLELRTADEQGLTRDLGVEVVDPDGRRPLSLKEAATAQAVRLTRSGFYQLRLASGRQEVVGVNPDRRESDLAVMPDDVQAVWRGNPRGEPASVSAGQAPEREEPHSLWWYIMILALVAALSESWLASRYLSTPIE